MYLLALLAGLLEKKPLQNVETLLRRYLQQISK